MADVLLGSAGRHGFSFAIVGPASHAEALRFRPANERAQHGAAFWANVRNGAGGLKASRCVFCARVGEVQRHGCHLATAERCAMVAVIRVASVTAVLSASAEGPYNGNVQPLWVKMLPPYKLTF